MPEPKHLFREQDVLDLISLANGANHCDISARATVHVGEGAATVELASTLDIDCEQPSERFRVTVERVDGPTSPASMGGPLSEAKRLAEIRARLAAAKDTSGGTVAEFVVAVNSGYEVRAHAADDLEFLLDLVGVLEGQLATAQERHQPVRRYHGPDTDDRSFETPEEAAEYDDVPPSAVRHFDICKTCGDMEVHDDEWRAYEWSLWPCKEAVALGLDGGDPDAA